MEHFLRQKCLLIFVKQLNNSCCVKLRNLFSNPGTFSNVVLVYYDTSLVLPNGGVITKYSTFQNSFI